ncbi:tRNA pseudouridine(55) synthase TruB [bacterium]|nr:tRNA pseudouridine(55) synthase TruB [bacterium]
MVSEKIIPIYKPIGFSSFDIIRRFKKETGFVGKIGHGGTLDPFACGVLILLLGDATKKFDEVISWNKTYLVGIRFGAMSSSQDIAGDIKMANCNKILLSELKEKLSQLSNKNLIQKVSPFSAAKHNGKPLYKLAKKGIIIEKSKEISIGDIEIISYRWPLLTIRVNCSRGAYMRQFAEDIGNEFGCKCFVYFLEREKVGKYNIKSCYKIDKLNSILEK